MSYMRDGDRRTRGVGAVAAADNVSGARRRRQADIHHVTRQRDRAMADIAQGALGRVPMGPGGVVRISEPTDTTYNPPRAISPPTIVSRPPMYNPPAVSPPPTIPPPPPPAGTLPPPLPYPGPVVSPPPPSSGGDMTGGSSGSGVTLGPGKMPPISIDPTQPLPDVPDAADHTARNLAIAGGVALAAYLVFFRGKS